jgi:hypothetical protein
MIFLRRSVQFIAAAPWYVVDGNPLATAIDAALLKSASQPLDANSDLS